MMGAARQGGQLSCRRRRAPDEVDEDHRSGCGAEEHMFDLDPVKSGRARF